MSQDGGFDPVQTQIEDVFLSNSDSEDSFTRVGSFSSVSSFIQPSPLPPEILFSPTDSSTPAITLEEDTNPSFKATSWLVSTAAYLGKQIDDATDELSQQITDELMSNSNNPEIIAPGLSESPLPPPLEHTDSAASLDSQAVFDSHPSNATLERNDSQESVKSVKSNKKKDSGKKRERKLSSVKKQLSIDGEDIKASIETFEESLKKFEEAENSDKKNRFNFKKTNTDSNLLKDRSPKSPRTHQRTQSSRRRSSSTLTSSPQPPPSKPSNETPIQEVQLKPEGSPRRRRSSRTKPYLDPSGSFDDIEKKPPSAELQLSELTEADKEERRLRRQARDAKKLKRMKRQQRQSAVVLHTGTTGRPSGVLGILLDYLDNNINLVGKMHDKGTFTNILVNIWGKICSKLKDVVETKPELQEEHYTRVGDSLKFLKHHFQHQGGGGSMEETMTQHPQYIEVTDVIELQKKKTEELIIRHYKEQSSDRGERSTGAGVIDLKLSLKERRDGKAILFVKLLGARELIALDSNGKSDPFIVLQVVPSHLYPDCGEKQSTVKKGTLEPIYNEMFEFIIPQNNIPHGVLVITVYDYDFISANDFEGEAMVRLTDLPRNSEQHVKWTMALHRPKKDSIYKILEGRATDKMAARFVETRRRAMEADILDEDGNQVTEG